MSLLLLIAGLLMTSSMISHYLIADEGATDSEGPLATLSRYFNQDQRANQNSETDEQGFNSLLSTPWPRMKLTGFGKSKEESGNFAIINGKKIHPGQNIAGKVHLVEIRNHDVLVEYKGESRILTIEN